MTNTIDFYSYEQQDEFILNLFGHKKNGFFIDVACGHPILGNNTYCLDKNFGWNGFCFELGDVSTVQYVTGHDLKVNTVSWKDMRRAEYIKIDATSKEFSDYLSLNVPKDLIVDYISLDVDGGGRNLAFETLNRILEAGVRFKAMTFEHEIYLNDKIQPASRELLESLGYRRLFSDVRLWGGSVLNDEGCFSEDWWIDPQYFDSNIMDISLTGEYFFNCAKAMKNYSGVDYAGHHHCCQAYATEVDLFDTQGSHGYYTHAIRTPGWKSAWE